MHDVQSEEGSEGGAHQQAEERIREGPAAGAGQHHWASPSRRPYSLSHIIPHYIEDIIVLLASPTVKSQSEFYYKPHMSAFEDTVHLENIMGYVLTINSEITHVFRAQTTVMCVNRSLGLSLLDAWFLS